MEYLKRPENAAELEEHRKKRRELNKAYKEKNKLDSEKLKIMREKSARHTRESREKARLKSGTLPNAKASRPKHLPFTSLEEKKTALYQAWQALPKCAKKRKLILDCLMEAHEKNAPPKQPVEVKIPEIMKKKQEEDVCDKMIIEYVDYEEIENQIEIKNEYDELEIIKQEIKEEPSEEFIN